MNGQILTPREAYEHLQNSIKADTPGKEQVLEILNWMCEFNDELIGDDRIICYIREGANVGYALEHDRYRGRKRNFLVVKLQNIARPDFYVRDFHLDLDLGEEGYPPFQGFLKQKQRDTAEREHPTRWACTGIIA